MAEIDLHAGGLSDAMKSKEIPTTYIGDGMRSFPDKLRPSLHGIDILEKMLTVDPKTRPTAGELLKHPWFANMGHD